MKKFYRPMTRQVRNAFRRLRPKRQVPAIIVEASEPEPEPRQFRHTDLMFRDPGVLKPIRGASLGENADDGAMIDRILAAYGEAGGDRSKPDAIWESIYNSHQKPLHDILVGSDRQAIEELLRNPGSSNLFYGFDGLIAQYTHYLKQPSGQGIGVALAPFDHLLAAAEIMGALRFESIEAGQFGYGAMPADDIMDAIDSKLGVRLTFPNPYPDEVGLQTNRGIATYRAVHGIYQAWRIRQLVKGIPNPRVLEIGGGLGRTAFYAWQMGIKDYTIIDLPFTGVSQGYFLMRTLGEDNVILHGEGGDGPSPKVKLFQPAAFLDGRGSYDLIVNVDSLTEMGRATADAYWRRIREATPQFLSINHEANHFTVSELANDDMPHVNDYQRYPYGLRKGYAEELFTF